MTSVKKENYDKVMEELKRRVCPGGGGERALDLGRVLASEVNDLASDYIERMRALREHNAALERKISDLTSRENANVFALCDRLCTAHATAPPRFVSLRQSYQKQERRQLNNDRVVGGNIGRTAVPFIESLILFVYIAASLMWLSSMHHQEEGGGSATASYGRLLADAVSSVTISSFTQSHC
jgi:hypothetical protein